MLVIKSNYRPLEFSPPEQIDEDHYNYLKENLKNDEHFKIETMVPFWPRYKYFIIAVLLCLLAIIFLLFYRMFAKKDGNPLIYGIPIFILMISYFPLMIFISRILPYLIYRRREKKYFSSISEAILKSERFEDFVTSIYAEKESVEEDRD